MSAVQDHPTQTEPGVVLDEQSREWLDGYAADKNPTKEHEAIVAKSLELLKKARRTT